MMQSELDKILKLHKKWLNNEDDGERANLCGTELRDSDLCGAELDFSCWPLWCGGLHVKTDKRVMAQLAYHFCNQDCDDPEYVQARNAILPFANQFHLVDECGKLEPLEVSTDDNC